MGVEPHPAAAALDTLVIDRIESVDHPIGGAGSEHRIERGNDLGRRRAIASRQTGEQHCFAPSEEVPGIDAVDTRTTRQQPDEEGRISVLGEAPDHVIPCPSGRFHRARQSGDAGLQTTAFVVAGEKRLGGGFQRLIGIAVQPVTDRASDGMGDCDGVLSFKIVKFDAEPPKSIAAAAPCEGQAHGRFRHRSVFIADQGRDRSVWTSVHSSGQLLFVGTAEQESNQAVALQQSGIAKRAISSVSRRIRLRGHEGGKATDQFVGDIGNKAAKHRRH